MGQITVYSGPERQRRWSEHERRLILTEAFSPGACVAKVARRHDVSTALVYTWRRKLLEAAAEPNVSVGHDAGFAEATIVDGGEGLSAERAPDGYDAEAEKAQNCATFGPFCHQVRLVPARSN